MPKTRQINNNFEVKDYVMAFSEILLLSLNNLGEKTAEAAAPVANAFAGNLGILAIGIVLVIAAIFILTQLKNIIIHSVVGLIAWAIIVFVFKIELPFWLSLIASAIFGLAGIGVMLLLKFAGINF